MRTQFLFASLTTLALLGACVSPQPPVSDSPDTSLARAALRLPQLSPCNLPNVEETVLCGKLSRFEDPDKPQGRSISIFVVVIPAHHRNPHLDPWVEISGGPGNAATDYARDYVGRGSYIAYRQDRDVLLVDARGMGHSNPLYCKELALHRVSSLFPRFPPEAVSMCRERLSATTDLSAYSTVRAADDLDAVRAWLGYSKLNLFSYSYGTRAALMFMQQYPESVRSAILWGVVPPDYRRPLYYARDSQTALERLLADCLANQPCRGAFPNIRDELRLVLERLDRHPVPVTLKHPLTGAQLSTSVTRAGFAQGLWVALSMPDQAHRLPLVIHHAARGDFAPFLAMDVASAPPRRRYYNAAHLSIVCPEEVQHIRREEIEALHRGTFMPQERTYEYLRACELWKVPTLPASLLGAVTSDTPTLLLSGWLDPFTPPELGDRVARTLSNARHVVVRHLSHESDGLLGVECLDSLFLDFVRHAQPASLDTTCVTTIQPPSFVLE